MKDTEKGDAAGRMCCNRKQHSVSNRTVNMYLSCVCGAGGRVASGSAKTER